MIPERHLAKTIERVNRVTKARVVSIKKNNNLHLTEAHWDTKRIQI